VVLQLFYIDCTLNARLLILCLWNLRSKTKKARAAMSTLYDSRLEPDDPIIATIKPGMIVAYRLRSEDLPQNPNKTWRGKVIRCDADKLLVEILEEGYHGLTEHINYQQVIGCSS